MSDAPQTRDSGRSAGVAHPPSPRSDGVGRTVLRTVALGLLVSIVGGCATKRDVRDLRTDIIALQIQQDSLIALLERQNAAVIDSIDGNRQRLASNRDLMMNVSGELGHQLLEMEEQLIQIQELTGQGQRRIRELRREMDRRSTVVADTAAASDARDGGEASGDADAVYRAGMDQLERDALQTARQAFRQVLESYPNHDRAPDAQFQLAETYAQEGDYDRALDEFGRVVELFPNSSRAPRALYRAGVISEERGNISRAREYFERVVMGYPTSDAARAARQRLDELQ